MASSSNNNAEYYSSDDDDHDMSLIIFNGMVVSALPHILRQPKPKEPQRTCTFSGQEWVEFLMAGNQHTIKDVLRMNTDTFQSLAHVLAEGGLLRMDKMRCGVEEQLGMFLFVCGQRVNMHLTGDRFQRSSETVSRHFRRVCKALCRLATIIIQPPDYNYVNAKIFNNGNLYPWFQEAVGAIDGTLISASPPADIANRFRARRNGLTTNVMAACDWDMKFTFIHAGWEGSAHDSNVLRDALQRPDIGFPLPPENKFYLVDSGYTNMPGFLAPYRDERYDMPEFYGGDVAEGRNELFNVRHSSLRTTIERTFGVFKKRFPIFRDMPHYKPSRQGPMLIACCAIHNWIRMNSLHDKWFVEAEDGWDLGANAGDAVFIGNASPNILQLDMSPNGVEVMSQFRNALAGSMWANQ